MPTGLLGSTLVAALVLGACFRDPPRSQLGTEERPPSSGENMSGTIARDMLNCPCTVPGATSRLVFLERDIELIVEGPPAAVGKIRRLAAYQVEHHGANRARRGRHTGRGTGAGRMGFCPIVHAGTDLELTEITDGVRILIKPRDARHARRLRIVTASRVQAVRTRALTALIDRPRWRASDN